MAPRAFSFYERNFRNSRTCFLNFLSCADCIINQITYIASTECRQCSYKQ